MQFVEYRCGHAAPVHGQGAVVTRLCPACAENLAPHAGLNAWMVIRPRTNITPSTILGHTVVFPEGESQL